MFDSSRDSIDDRIYLEIEDYEIGNCAICHKPATGSQSDFNPHIALCLECEELIKSQEEIDSSFWSLQ